MKVALFSSHCFERPFFEKANQAHGHSLHRFAARLNRQTASLAAGFSAVSCFVTDELSQAVLDQLSQGGTHLLALRSAGFDHVDLQAAHRLGLTVTRVPDYSPYAIAEFAVGLLLSLNRKIHRAHMRVRAQNFSLDGLMGFDVHGRTVGIIGTGSIGAIFARIMLAFGCQVLATDPEPKQHCTQWGVRYVPLAVLYRQSDIISLHCPLTAQTRHLIDDTALATMKDGVMLINTGRGALLDTPAVIRALKSEKVGYLGIDVYEGEDRLFFRHREDDIIQDDVFARLQSFPNVLITGHQGFFTREALARIAKVTLANITAFEHGKKGVNTV